jgi:hypothetical protein
VVLIELMARECPSRPERPEGLIVVYDGGILAADEVAAITLPGGQHASCRGPSGGRDRAASYRSSDAGP